MCERTVSLAVRLRVIRFVLLEDVVDGSQQHKGDGDDGLLVTTALLQSEIAMADFWVLLCPDSTERTLHQQGLDVCPSPAAPGGFLFFRHFHCKPSPGAEMLRGGKNGHIHANLRDDANSGKGLDT